MTVKAAFGAALLTVLGLMVGCESIGSGPNCDAVFLVREYIESAAESSNLSAEAVLTSGVLAEAEASGEAYTLFMVGRPVTETDDTACGTQTAEQDALPDYLESQDLTEEAFLASPKLTAFMRHQLILDLLDVGQLAQPAARLSYLSTADTELVFTSSEDADVSEDIKYFVNGVPMSISCAEQVVTRTLSRARVCSAQAPLAEEFEW